MFHFDERQSQPNISNNQNIVFLLKKRHRPVLMVDTVSLFFKTACPEKIVYSFLRLKTITTNSPIIIPAADSPTISQSCAVGV